MIKDYNQHARIWDSGMGVHPQNVDLTDEAADYTVDLLVTKYCAIILFLIMCDTHAYRMRRGCEKGEVR